MNRTKMCEYLERMDNGGVSSVGAEEIFTAENPEEIVSPPEKTEEYLQQHKLFYRNNQ